MEVVAKWVQPDYVEGAYFENGEAALTNTFRPEDEQTLDGLLYQLDR